MAIDAQLVARGLKPADPEWEGAWDDAWQRFWRDPSNLPAATCAIDVVRPEYLAHIAVGRTWRSAAYRQ